MHHERDLVLGRKRQIEPAVEAERVQVRESVDLRLALGRLTKALAMPFLDGSTLTIRPFQRPGRSKISRIMFLSIAARKGNVTTGIDGFFGDGVQPMPRQIRGIGRGIQNV